MTDEKPFWPKEIGFVVMTTKERDAMEKHVREWAFGKGLRHKLREAYKAGFVAGKKSEIKNGNL